ncbi:MAG: hypothetical protein MO847_11985 [Candidatus Protistobacter heckmanni]|nr:hypothetical protein [Candidatus Protistobacter heckmanni]
MSSPSTGYKNGTTVDNDPATATNNTYDDLLAIWDAYNGSSTGTGASGVPAGWNSSWYWSATPSGSGPHYAVLLGNGSVGNGNVTDTNYVALQVL